MNASLALNQTGKLSISFLDAAGVVISPTPVLDAPPSWTVSDASIASLSTTADGLTATFSPILLGTATVSLALLSAGLPFNATAVISVGAGGAGQLASIEIVLTAMPKV